MMQTTDYLNTLAASVQQMTDRVEALTRLYTHVQLIQRPDPARWSVLDNLEHLSLYGDFYLPTFDKAIQKGLQYGWTPRATFREGWLGGFFVRSMRPRGNKIANPMKTFKDKNPILTAVPAHAAERFVKQQHELLEILNRARQTDIRRLRIGTTLGPFPRISLGDGLAFIIAHQERHFLQIERTLVETGVAPQAQLRWG